MTGGDLATVLVALVVEDSGARGPLLQLRVVAVARHGRQIPGPLTRAALVRAAKPLKRERPGLRRGPQRLAVPV